MDFHYYFSRFARRIYYFIAIMLVTAAVSITLAVVLPPNYVALARLLLESEQIPDELAASTVRIPPREQLQIIQQRILTRSVLLEMANRLGVYDGYVSRKTLNPDEIVTDMRDRIVITLPNSSSGIRGRNGNAELFTVSFSAERAELSAQVANEIVTKILAENVEMRTENSSQTLVFFEQSVDRLEKQLIEAGALISTFRSENQDALPDGLEFRRTALASAQERAIVLERDLTRIKEHRIKVQQLFETTGQVILGQDSLEASPQVRQLNQLRLELEDAQLVLTPENPRIKAIMARIKQLESRVNSSEGRAANQMAYEIQIHAIDDEILRLTDEKVALEETMAKLAQSIKDTPANGIRLDGLRRNYSSLSDRYDAAVSNRARAQTGNLIETLSKGGRITVIEQAVVPLEPTSPNRPLIAALGVASGVLFGIAAVFFIEVMSGAVRRPADIISNLGITPFATLPLIRTHNDIRQRRMIVYGSFAFTLIAVPFALWIVHIYLLPLDLLMQSFIRRFNIVDALPFTISPSQIV